MRTTKQIAIGGFLIGLAWMFIVMATFLPTGRSFAYFLASVCVALASEWLSPGRAVLVALGIAALLLVRPGLLSSVFFALYFGSYPLAVSFLQHYFSIHQTSDTNRPDIWISQLVGTLLCIALAELAYRASLIVLPAWLSVGTAQAIFLFAIQPLVWLHRFLLNEAIRQSRSIFRR